MSGALHAIAYRTVAATGRRVNELRSLAPESFRLDGADPIIFARAGDTKNRHSVEQRIPVALAGDLRHWIAGKAPGESVFPLHHGTAKAIRANLTAAGIPYDNDEGAADLHSLRALYVSALVRAGATIKEVQTLARHSKPETTLKHYTKVAPHDLRWAVESIPSPSPKDTPEAMAATGTEEIYQRPFAPLLPRSGDAHGRIVADGTSMQGMDSEAGPTPQLLEDIGDCRVVAGAVGESRVEAPGGFEPPYNGFADRRLTTWLRRQSVRS